MRFANEFYRTITASFIAALGRKPILNKKDPLKRKWEQLMFWLLRTTLTRGETFVAKKVKSFSDAARGCIFENMSLPLDTPIYALTRAYSID